ncbi:hypothetical protein SprV_0100311300 [Sparganum proliferum]
MAAEQQRVGCPGNEFVSGLQLKDVPLTTGSGTILCDVSAPFHRPFVPASMRRAVFQTMHGLSHPGIQAFQNLLEERFVWPGMNKDAKAWALSCLSCQRNKVQRHNKFPPGTLPSPDARFSHMHLDVVGSLPPSNGFTHLFTCVDRYTRWAEAIPLSDAQVETIVKAFVSRWVAMFGAPSTVTTDRGAQFESALFQTLFNFLGCTRIRTTAYHPAAHGIVERFHRQLKTALCAVKDPGNCSDNLPLALLGIRAALKSDLDCSAAELVFGTTLRLPGEIVTPTSHGADETPENLVHRLRQFMRSLSPIPPRTPMTESNVEKTWTTVLKCSSGVTVCASRWNHHTKDRSACSRATPRPAGFFAVTRRTWSVSIGSRLLLQRSRWTCHKDKNVLTSNPCSSIFSIPCSFILPTASPFPSLTLYSSVPHTSSLYMSTASNYNIILHHRTQSTLFDCTTCLHHSQCPSRSFPRSFSYALFLDLCISSGAVLRRPPV